MGSDDMSSETRVRPGSRGAGSPGVMLESRGRHVTSMGVSAARRRTPFVAPSSGSASGPSPAMPALEDVVGGVDASTISL